MAISKQVLCIFPVDPGDQLLIQANIHLLTISTGAGVHEPGVARALHAVVDHLQLSKPRVVMSVG